MSYHFLGFRVVGILVRMILERQSAVLFLDLLRSGCLRDVQQLVQRISGAPARKE